MQRSRVLLALATATAIAVCAQVASAEIYPGTKLTGSIDRNLSSKDTQVGQTFMLSNVHTSNYDINGATLYGHVAHVQRAGQGTPGKIELEIDKVNTRSGNIYKVVGQATNVQVITKSNAGREAGAAAAGALVGGLLGSGAGAAIGGAGGFLFARNSRENVSIPQGSLVTVEVSQSYKVTK